MDPPVDDLLSRHGFDAFALHPLAAAFHVKPEFGWHCREPIPNREAFKVVLSPNPPSEPNESRDCNVFLRTCHWLSRRGVQVFGHGMGLVDAEASKVYYVDIVGNRNGRLVLTFMYSSERRWGNWDEMVSHASAVAKVAKAVYHVRPFVAVVNLSNDLKCTQGLLWYEA